MIGGVLAAQLQCSACGGTALEPHMRVAGSAGPDGLIPTTNRFGTALADIVRCTRCGHMQLERFPAEAELAEAYGEAASEDYLVEERGQRATARRVLERIERHAQRGSICDLGCWLGFLLDEARARGWERVAGVEPSAFASAYARDELSLDVYSGGLMDADPGAGFDAAVMADVIEHLPDPGAALDRVRALLHRDGVLALALPDAGSTVARAMGRRWWSVIPTHVQYFTRRSLAMLLARHGYEVVSLTTAPKAFSVRYYLGRLGGYNGRIAGVLVRVSARGGVADRLWAPDFRDRMLAIARASGRHS